MDLMREAIDQADRARRAEAEVDRLHRWIEHGCQWPPPGASTVGAPHPLPTGADMTPEPIDYTGPDLAPAPATQTAHPWRATARTALAYVVGAGIVLPAVWAVLVEVLGVYLPPAVIQGGAWVVGLVCAVSLAVTRIIAIPQVNAWLARIGLSAAPKND